MLGNVFAKVANWPCSPKMLLGSLTMSFRLSTFDWRVPSWVFQDFSRKLNSYAVFYKIIRTVLKSVIQGLPDQPGH